MESTIVNIFIAIAAMILVVAICSSVKVVDKICGGKIGNFFNNLWK